MPKTVVIYGKSGWPYTTAARDDYGRRNVQLEYVDVKMSREGLDRMLSLNGGTRQVPTIVEEGKVIVGFGGTWGVWSSAVADIRFKKIQVESLKIGIWGRPGEFCPQISVHLVLTVKIPADFLLQAKVKSNFKLIWK